VREFLARNKVEFEFEDVRKQPVSLEDTIALVRAHRVAFAKKGSKLIELDPKKATDEEIAKAFIGNSGTLRAPTIAVGDKLLGGWDEATFAARVK
jgi:arsenate reductase-like glutaredoxin family protein